MPPSPVVSIPGILRRTICRPVPITANCRAASLCVVALVLAVSSSCNGHRRQPAASTGGAAIQNKGSDTLLQLAQAWAEAYRDVRPEVAIAVTGGGTGTGIAALMNGTADIANASRPMKQVEIDAAIACGFEPVEHVVAIDAVAVVVNPENPVDRLTIAQLADIYTGRTTNWSDVGGTDSPIVLLSRETNSGTHVYFLEEVVRGGDKDNPDIFAPQTLLMPSSVGITSELGRNPNAIGYDGLGYITDDEKMIAVAPSAEGPYVLPSSETATDGSYPLSRPLFMYTAGEPVGEIAEYLDWVRGASAQDIVRDLGFVPASDE